MKLNEQSILNVIDSVETIPLLQKMPKRLIDCHEFIKVNKNNTILYKKFNSFLFSLYFLPTVLLMISPFKKLIVNGIYLETVIQQSNTSLHVPSHFSFYNICNISPLFPLIKFIYIGLYPLGLASLKLLALLLSNSENEEGLPLNC